MKKIGILGFGLLLLSNPLLAANPKTGWYAGVLVGGNYAFPNDITFVDPNTFLVTEGDLKYGGFFNFGIYAGYRFWENFRSELEFLIMGNDYENITVGDTTYISPKKSATLRLKGKTTTMGLLANAYYDFIVPGGSFAPYVGAGIGYGRINNSLNFYFNNQLVQGTRVNDTFSSPIAQAIIGAGYHLDDFTWFGLDLRYMVAHSLHKQGTTTELIDQPLHVVSVNLSFSGMIDCL